MSSSKSIGKKILDECEKKFHWFCRVNFGIEINLTRLIKENIKILNSMGMGFLYKRLKREKKNCDSEATKVRFFRVR